MGLTALSRIQFVTLGLIYASPLFTKEDVAHISRCEVTVDKTSVISVMNNAPVLLVFVDFWFKDWSYTDHKPDANTYVEVDVTFYQTEDRKLTGKVELQFLTGNTTHTFQLDYLQGW